MHGSKIVALQRHKQRHIAANFARYELIATGKQGYYMYNGLVRKLLPCNCSAQPCDDQHFRQYQQNQKPSLASIYWTQNYPQHVALEIHVLAWDRHKYVCIHLYILLRCIISHFLTPFLYRKTFHNSNISPLFFFKWITIRGRATGICFTHYLQILIKSTMTVD